MKSKDQRGAERDEGSGETLELHTSLLFTTVEYVDKERKKSASDFG